MKEFEELKESGGEEETGERGRIRERERERERVRERERDTGEKKKERGKEKCAVGSIILRYP